MKKFFVTLMCTLFVCTAFAGNPLKFISGDKKFFKNAKGNCALEVIYDGASFDDKMPLTEKYSNVPEKTKISYDGFVEEFSERIKDFVIVKDEKDVKNAQYKMVIKVTKIDEFINPMGFVVGPCIRVWGTLTITDIKGGAPLLEVNIDEIDGGSAATTDRAFNDSFGELGKRIAKFK